MIRILLVEDDASMRSYIARALQRAGYIVEPVGSGAEALILLGRESHDLLLTDIEMPEFGGIDLARRAATIAPDMRVMFITGFAVVTLKPGTPPDQTRQLSQPVHLRDLVQEVGRLFELGTATEL